jgi:hypothetical protein
MGGKDVGRVKKLKKDNIVDPDFLRGEEGGGKCEVGRKADQ